MGSFLVPQILPFKAVARVSVTQCGGDARFTEADFILRDPQESAEGWEIAWRVRMLDAQARGPEFKSPHLM